MFKIYSKQSCPFCTKAKNLLTSLSIPYEEVDVAGNAQMKMYVKQTHGTYPMILHGDVLVGGYIELEDYLIDNGFV